MADAPRHDSYLDPYRRYLQRAGVDFGVTLWASTRSQERRFDVIRRSVFLAGKRILDAGCGRGDLAAYLLEHDLGFDRYIGIDALDPVIAHARDRGLPNCEFHQGDVLRNPQLLALGRPHIICISGTLNTMTRLQAMELLEAAWSAAGQTLVFNFLSNRAGPGASPQTEPVTRHDTLALIDWALGKTWNVIFRQDYYPEGHDATVVMRKQEK